MSFVYHIKPNEMKGDLLFPLSMLEDKYPDIYDKEIQKYNGRERLLEQRVDVLDCMWKDVLHCSAVSPQLIVDALTKLDPELEIDLEWYCIPIDILPVKNTAHYSYENEDDTIETILFDPEAYSELNVLPIKVINYYEQCILNRERPLWFHLIPHVLVQGVVDVSECKVICSQ